MPSYDPRRSRPTPKVVPDEESAPIDVLLGPDPDPGTVASNQRDGEAPDLPAPQPRDLPVPVRRVESRPSALTQLAPLAVVGAFLVLVVWLLGRRRRG